MAAVEQTEEASVGPGGRVPRRDANKAAKLSRIVAAAREEFHRKGFYDTKLSDVAHEARVAKGTLFLYAESKEALLWLVFSEDLGPTLLASLDVEGDRPLRGKMIEHFDMAARLQQGVPELARVAAKELTWANPPSERTLAFIEAWLGRLTTTIEQAQTRGEIHDSHSASLLARLIIDVYFGVAQSWLTGRDTFALARERLVASIDLILVGAAVAHGAGEQRLRQAVA